MRDEMRACECGAEHPWGVVGESRDHVKLYGPRAILTCGNFRPKPAGEQLSAAVDARELWEKTGDLSPQATLATRVVVSRIRDMATGVGKYQRMTEQWGEFMNFVISQVTDMRGALVRDESKFAHLVAHTDEVVESMRGVVQLGERLGAQSAMLVAILERLDRVEGQLKEEASATEITKLDELLAKSAAASQGEVVDLKDDEDPEEEEAGREQPEDDEDEDDEYPKDDEKLGEKKGG